MMWCFLWVGFYMSVFENGLFNIIKLKNIKKKNVFNFFIESFFFECVNNDKA